MGLKTRPWGEVGRGELLFDLAEAWALHLPGALDPDQARSWAAEILRRPDLLDWAFSGEQACLGLAWYTHLEEGRAAEYFAKAQASDARVRGLLPGLAPHLQAALEHLLDAPLRPRPGWCGPGVHWFAPDCPTARRGGVVHYDHEGLSPMQREEEAPAFTAVLCLRPAAVGGGLRVWERRWPLPEVAPAEPPLEIPYQAGDLVLIEARRLHQIAPFQDTGPRLTATVHLAWAGDDWEWWF